MPDKKVSELKKGDRLSNSEIVKSVKNVDTGVRVTVTRGDEERVREYASGDETVNVN